MGFSFPALLCPLWGFCVKGWSLRGAFKRQEKIGAKEEGKGYLFLSGESGNQSLLWLRFPG